MKQGSVIFIKADVLFWFLNESECQAKKHVNATQLGLTNLSSAVIGASFGR